MNEQPAPLHIFFAGTHTACDGSQHIFSQDDIADLVASYDPSFAEAQLVVGHPKLEDPSYGGIESLVLDAKGVHAVPRNVDADFAGLVNAGRFPSISASIYRPETAGNPKPGHFYLRHVGFLGAQPPSLKGLKRPTLNFAEGDAALEFAMPLGRQLNSLGYYLKRFFQGFRDRAIETDGIEKADQLIPQWCIDGIAEATAGDDATASAFAEVTNKPEIPMDKTATVTNAADFAEQQNQLATQKTAQDAREKALNDRESAARRSDATDFAEGLVAAGKLLPRQKQGAIELLLSTPAGTVLNFAEVDGQTAADHDAHDTLRALLTDMPVQVNFAEKSSGQDNATVASADFAAPEGARVDAGRMELHSKAVAYQRQHPNTDYMTAVHAVGG